MLYVVQHTSGGQFGHNKARVTTVNKAAHLVLSSKIFGNLHHHRFKTILLRVFKIGMSTYICGM
jgi:hypothetical protein